MELHPDRNYGNVEKTTKLFAEVQSAYAVLSDPQERAWYDSHWGAILQDDVKFSENHYEHNVQITTTEDILKMLSKFDGRMDFSDSASGFYTKIRVVFANLAKEEELACKWQPIDFVEYPSFGHADDDYEHTVRPFYAAWNSFATSKTFSWKDAYRYSEAHDRRERRMMERENKRFREEAVHEFNDCVRSLVAFVKKRDPRFKSNLKTEAERQKALRDAALAQAARSRAANQVKSNLPHEIPSWTNSHDPSADNSTEEEEETIEEQVECVVCKKMFKSEKQYESHERSNKHIKATQQIRREMQKEDQTLNLLPRQSSSLSPPNEVQGEDLSKQPTLAEHDILASHENVILDTTATFLVADSESYKPTIDNLDEYQLTTEKLESPSSTTSLSYSSGDDYATREVIQERILEGDGPSERTQEVSNVDKLALQISREPFMQEKIQTMPSKVGKAKEKRAKKAAQQGTANKRPDLDVSIPTLQHQCPLPH